MRLNRATVLALAGAAVFAVACDRGNTAKNETTTPPAAGAAGTAASAPAATTEASKPSVVLTGCLQEEKGVLGDYILTQAKPVMSPGEATGTSGAADEKTGTGEPKGIEQRQLAQAERSYRLSGESDQLKENVGHQIRVRGTLANRGDVAKSDNDVSQSDLAKVDVASVELIASSCNAGARKK
jgi:hypothetical protein